MTIPTIYVYPTRLFAPPYIHARLGMLPGSDGDGGGGSGATWYADRAFHYRRLVPRRLYHCKQPKSTLSHSYKYIYTFLSLSYTWSSTEFDFAFLSILLF